eukprot:scaffold301_cov370-Pavlova_lutheri.AAC.25
MAEFLRSSSWNLSCVAINCSRRSKVVADGSSTTQKGAFDNCSTFKVTSIRGNILLSIHLRTCYRRSRRVPMPSTVKRVDGGAVSIFAEISCNTSTTLLWSCQQTTAMGVQLGIRTRSMLTADTRNAVKVSQGEERRKAGQQLKHAVLSILRIA